MRKICDYYAFRISVKKDMVRIEVLMQSYIAGLVFARAGGVALPTSDAGKITKP